MPGQTPSQLLIGRVSASERGPDVSETFRAGGGFVRFELLLAGGYIRASREPRHGVTPEVGLSWDDEAGGDTQEGGGARESSRKWFLHRTDHGGFAAALDSDHVRLFGQRLRLKGQAWETLGSVAVMTRVSEWVRRGWLEVSLALLFLLPEAANAWRHHSSVGLGAGVLICGGFALAPYRPGPGFAVLALGLAAVSVIPPSEVLATPLVPLMATASFAARGRHRVGLCITLGGLALSLWLSRRARGLAQWSATVLVWSAAYIAAWMVGLATLHFVLASSRRLHDGLESQRRLIAAELHDDVAHDLSLLVMRAEAARRDPAIAQDELLFIAETGRRANRNLRSMMELLRVNDRFVPLSLEASLAQAAEQVAVAGLILTQSIEGDLSTLPPATSDTLARIIREAVNNMVRHAIPDHPCAIWIQVTGAAVVAAFTNGWDGTRGQGLGLEGITERCRAAGGTARVLTRNSLWVLSVKLPR